MCMDVLLREVMISSTLFYLFLATLQAKTAIFSVLAASGCKEMDFKVTMKDNTLANHVFKTVRATNDAHCESQCFLDDRCISYSFGTSASGEKYMCELSDSDHFMHPEDLVRRPGVIYRSAQNTCPCRGRQTCRYDFIQKTAKCVCPTGFTGQNCETNIDDCFDNACYNGGSCVDQVNGYTCQCVPGRTGQRCEIDIDDCQSSPCVNGTCSDRLNDFWCTCVPGYSGKTCDIDINECQSNPCLNGGTCHDKVNGFECSCTNKFYGSRCENLDNCVAHPCQNGGTCINKSIYRGGCTCPANYFAFRCHHFDPCGANPGVCKDGSTCRNALLSHGGYYCVCPDRKRYYYDKCYD
ncbi:fibropellin-3-like [Actinia tenebrosa]|uniref:Fibropellin-3-like n=1 Tax=Actinia tenebrosa TaxID=6105 RepID=A0A6P8HC53_ACTTE|nr:fibropellin-3-like [Actinia tenebrosa]